MSCTSSPPKLLLQIIPNSTQHPKPVPLLVPISAPLQEITKKACQKLKLKYLRDGKKTVSHSELYRLNGESILTEQELRHGDLLVVAAKGEPMKEIRLSKKEKKQMLLLGEDRGTWDRNAAECSSEMTGSSHSSHTSEASSAAKVSSLPAKSLLKLPFGVSEIIPEFLFVGSARDASHKDTLRQFSHIVNVSAGEFVSPRRLYEDIGVTFQEYPIEDTLSEDLHRWTGPVLEHLNDIRANSPNSRVLLHCVSGKSRSVAIAIAFMLHPKSGSNIQTLRDAFYHVNKARPIMGPNSRFISDLMAMECMDFEKNDSSLQWIHVAMKDGKHRKFDFKDWLRIEFHLGNFSGNPKPTHEYRDVTNHFRLHVPEWRYQEFLSVYGVEVLAHHSRFTASRSYSSDQYPLKMYEYFSHPEYKLNVDVQIKYDQHTEEYDLATVFSSYASRIQFAAQTVLPSLNENVIVQGSYLTNNGESAVQTQYLFKLVWSESEVRGNQHKSILEALESEFRSERALSFSCGEGSESSKNLQKTLMAYSMHTERCSLCGGSGQNTNPAKKMTKRQKKKRKSQADQQDCPRCEGSGLEKGLIFSFLGEYSMLSGKWATQESFEVDTKQEKKMLDKIIADLQETSVWVRNEDDFED
uniref:protein-tyrosine-phosphatase n=1 Tax=Percolomonas cosmopolitus TaxID=63605 RepID=A0A7S1PH48_9EUKA